MSLAMAYHLGVRSSRDWGLLYLVVVGWGEPGATTGSIRRTVDGHLLVRLVRSRA
jgi:hypothetical protein